MTLPIIFQNPRPRDFFGPEDYTGGDWEDDERDIKEHQRRWDEAYSRLTVWQKARVWWRFL